MQFIIVVILIMRIVRYAKQTNKSPLKWGSLLALNWFMFALSGAALVISYFNIKVDENFIKSNMVFAVLIEIFAIGCGFLGYFLTRRMMDRSVL